MTNPKRKPWICSENGCKKCDGLGACDVPGDCPVSILHALDMTQMGLVNRPRRSGKTTQILNAVEKIASVGDNVLVLFENNAMMAHSRKQAVRQWSRHWINNGSVIFATRDELKDGRVRGGDFGSFFVFTDEILPEEWDKIKDLLPKTEFVLGYYTER